MLDLITYPRFFCDVVAAEQHILRFILLNIFYDYSVELQILIMLTMVKTEIVVQFLTQLVILGFIPTGSQQTGFLNALKDSPARYPFIETNCRSCCKITSEICFCLFSCYCWMCAFGTLTIKDFITSCTIGFLATCWR